MKILTFGIVLCAIFGNTAMAQGAPAPTVGVVSGIDGLSTVSQGNTLSNLTQGQTILQGARVVTSSTGTVRIVLNNGCAVSLNRNEAVTIDSRLGCDALTAGIVQNNAAIAVAGATGSGNVVNSSVLGGAFFATGAVIKEISGNNPAAQALSGS